MATTILEKTPRSVTVRMSTGRWNRILQLEHTYRMANTIRKSMHQAESAPAMSAAEKKTRKAIKEIQSGKGVVCHSFEEYLKAVQ